MTVFQLTEFAKDLLSLLRDHKFVVTVNKNLAYKTTTEYSLEKKNDPAAKTA